MGVEVEVEGAYFRGCDTYSHSHQSASARWSVTAVEEPVIQLQVCVTSRGRRFTGLTHSLGGRSYFISTGNTDEWMARTRDEKGLGWRTEWETAADVAGARRAIRQEGKKKNVLAVAQLDHYLQPHKMWCSGEGETDSLEMRGGLLDWYLIISAAAPW